MTSEDYRSHVGIKRLRSGKVFATYYKVPNPDFNFDALGLAATEHEQDEPELANNPDEEVAWNDLGSPLSSLPSSRSASPSPVSTAPPSPEPSSPSPLPSTSPPTTTDAPISRRDADAAKLPPKGRKRRRIEHGRELRRKKRRAADALHPTTDRLQQRARQVARAHAKKVAFELKAAPVTRTGFRGKYEKGVRRTYGLRGLVKDGFVVYPWNGRDVVPLVALQPSKVGGPAVDARSNEAPEHHAAQGEEAAQMQEVVIGVLAGRPNDGNAGRTEGDGRPPQPPWDSVASSAADEVERGRMRATFAKDAREHRRGVFGAQAEGISHGGGQTRPANLKHSGAVTAVLLYLIGLHAMVRIAHFASAAFATWAPAVHEYYGATLVALLANDPTLQRNFAASVWACITVNFGPRTVTFPHRDYANLAFGWCAITALGKFNSDRGGHLILWECKMIIRFPPGSTILIPSAILTHGNTHIGRNERRYSVTQYSAGALFRWVEHGFQLDEAYYASLSADALAKDQATAAGRWRKGRAMFSTLDDLVAAADARAGTKQGM